MKEKREKKGPDIDRCYIGILELEPNGVNVILKGHIFDTQNEKLSDKAILTISPLSIFRKITRQTDCYDWALARLGEAIEVHFTRQKGEKQITFVHLDKEKGLQIQTFKNVKITF